MNALIVVVVFLIVGGVLAMLLTLPKNGPWKFDRRTVIVFALISMAVVLGIIFRPHYKPEPTKMGRVRTLIEKTYCGIEQYQLVFHQLPPATTPSGLTGIQALHYYLTTTFSPAPNLAEGERWADIYCASCSQYQDREIRTAAGGVEIIDPWGAALIYRLNVTTDEHGAEKVEPVIYLCGPNGIDDGGREGTDDVTVGR